VTSYQQRKSETAPDPKSGLARRATDTHLSGMHIDEANSDQAWQDWQEALQRQERESEPTQPSPLE
jgi:hypothetical protein